MFRKLRTTGLNKFRRSVAAFMAAVMLLVGLPAFVAEAAPAFTDLEEGYYYIDAVYWAVEKGITNGMTETTFGPNAACRREHVVTFLWRAAGSPEPTVATNPFTDIKEDDYFYRAVLWAVEKGITTGTTATTFAPTQDCTRGQIATFLYRFSGEPEVQANNPFTDLIEGYYYINAVLWAAQEGITTGTTPTTFAPDQTCTRAQIVTFMHRDKAAFEPAPEPQPQPQPQPQPEVVIPGNPADYKINVEGFTLGFDVKDNYYLATPADFTVCKITGFTGFKAIKVSVEQYASYYPYKSKAYVLGEVLALGYGRAKVTVTATLPNDQTLEYLICLTDPRAAENSYGLVQVENAASTVNVRKEPNTTSDILASLEDGTTVYYLGKENEEWCKVQQMKTATIGYIHKDYLQWNWKTVDMPASYEEGINKVKAAYPNATFTFVDTEMTLEQARAKYGNCTTDLDYLNPHTYLDEYQIFAFLDIDTYNPTLWTDEGTKAIWQNESTFTKDEALAFIKAASDSVQMNPYYIACRMALESTYGGSFLASGNSVANNVTIEYDITVNGMWLKEDDHYDSLNLGKTYYNFFGIGAYDYNPHWAILYAGNRGWDTKEKAIVEGVNWIKDQYLDRGSVTPYFFRYASYKREFQNSQNYHSYMTDIRAPFKEAAILRRAYGNYSETAMHFIIPVYRDLPTQ